MPNMITVKGAKTMIIERGARPDAFPDARPTRASLIMAVGVGLCLGLGVGIGAVVGGKRTPVAAPTLRQEFEVMLARYAEPKWGAP